MSADVPFEDHNQAIQELQAKLDAAQDVHDRHIAQLAKQYDAEITRRVAEAIATASTLKVIPSPLRPQKIFRPVSTPLQSFSSMAAGTSSSASTTVPLLAARTSSVRATTPQSALDEALRTRAIQQQQQEVDWNKRPLMKATLVSVTQLLKDFDVYKRKQGVKSLHECCGPEFLTLLEGTMAVDIPDAADGDDPLRALLVDTFETPETFDYRFKTACKALAMPKGKQANIEELQIYLSDFYSLIQGFVDRGQIDDADDPDFNLTLVSYFMANVEPLEMRNKMMEFRSSTFSGALKRFRTYLKPDIIALVNQTRAHNIAKHADNGIPDYKSRDTPKRANKLSVAEPTPDPRTYEHFQCDNCPGNHKTKNCLAFPCQKCKAAGKHHEHPQYRCPDRGGYPILPEPNSSGKVKFVARQSPRPIIGRLPKPSATRSSLTSPRPPTPPTIPSPPHILYVPPRDDDEEYHYSDGTYEDEEPPSDGDTVWSDGNGF
jgi:hypothetical protein